MNKYSILFLLLFLATSLQAQNLQGLNLLVISSEGNGVNAEGTKDAGEYLADNLPEYLNVKLKFRNHINLNALSQKMFSVINSFFEQQKPDDLAMIFILGCWEADRTDDKNYEFKSGQEEKLTLRYLENLVQFMPESNVYIFLLSPGECQFPTGALKNAGFKFANGKMIIVPKFKSGENFPDAIEELADLFDGSDVTKTNDKNNDRAVSISELMLKIDNALRILNIEPFYFSYGKAEDYKLFWLRD